MSEEIERLISIASAEHRAGNKRGATITLKLARALAASPVAIHPGVHDQYLAVHTAVYGNPPAIED